METILECDGTGCIACAEDIINSTYNTPNEISSLSIEIYPNPVSSLDELQIQINSESQQVLISIKNLVGQQLYNKRVQTEDYRNLQLQNFELSSGLYLISVEDGEERVVKEFMVME